MQRTLVLCFLLGCAANNGDGGMIILNNSAPAADTCAFTADPNEPFVARGALALGSPVPYLLTPLIESKITADMGQELQRTIEFRGAKIDISFGGISVQHTDGSFADHSFSADQEATMHDEGITHFKSLFSGSLPPSGFANVGFDILPLQLTAAISQQVAGDPGVVDAEVIVNVVPFGDLGGDEVDGDAFVYPVGVCNNCIVNDIGACSAIPTGATIATGNPCNPFQDGFVDCCEDGAFLRCPAPTTM